MIKLIPYVKSVLRDIDPIQKFFVYNAGIGGLFGWYDGVKHVNHDPFSVIYIPLCTMGWSGMNMACPITVPTILIIRGTKLYSKKLTTP